MRFGWMLMLMWSCALAGCAFAPDLEGQGYLRCERAADCDEACTCSAAGYCLPPDGIFPDACEPGLPSVESPWRLLLLDWSDPDTTHELLVDTPGDAPFTPEDQDYWTVYDQAINNDGALSLGEAFALAGLSEKPIRIRFSRDLFPPDGSGPAIELADAVELNADQVLLDGRDTGAVITYAGNPNGIPLNLLTVTGQVVALAGLRVEGHDERALRVIDAEGVFATGLLLDGNRIGMWVQRSSKVFLDDGAATLGQARGQPNVFEYNNAGLVVLQSQRVRINGTEVTGNFEEGIRFMQGCQDVTVGPIAGEDSVDWSHVWITDNFTGLNVSGFDGLAGVRGAVFSGNEFDVSIAGSQGMLAIVNATVAGTGTAVVEHHDSQGGFLLGLRNVIVSGQGAVHLRCYGLGDTLTINADRLLFSSGIYIDCTEYDSGFGDDALVWENLDPEFVDPAAGDFTLLAASPALDEGIGLDFEGVDLDFNGSVEGLFCGLGPDLGAFERCP